GVPAAALPVRLGGLRATLALTLQHSNLALLVELAARLLRLLLERVDQQPQSPYPGAVVRLRGGGQVGLDLLGDAHGVKGSGENRSDRGAEEPIGIQIVRSRGDRLSRRSGARGQVA